MPYVVGTAVEFSDNVPANTVTTIDAPNFTAVAGDTLIAVVVYYENAATVGVTMSDTVGTNDTWTRCETGAHFTDDKGIEAFYLENCAAGSCTVRATFANSVGFPGIFVVPVTGLASSSSFLDAVFNRQVTPGTGTDGVTTTNLATLSTQPAMIFGLAYDVAGATVAGAGTGFTNILTGWNYEGAFSISMRAEHKRVTVTTADDATWTALANTEHISVALAFKEATGSFIPRMTLLGAG